MKYIALLPFVFLLFTTACRKPKDLDITQYQCEIGYNDSSTANPKHQEFQQVLTHMTSSGVPGVMMAVQRDDYGMWLGASGKADLHYNVDMQACNITRVGSTVKVFTAVTVLKLYEESKLDLDDKISVYLSAEVLDKIENADQVTIRQLLNHSSGIYNYIQNLKFQTASINDLIREWKPDDLLKYAHHKKAYFSPGSDVRYSNTNYILLGMLIEKIEGKPFYHVFEEKIFTPLGLSKTSFAAENPVPEGIARGYIDLYSNLNVIESTYYSGWDYYTADGGLISNPYDMVIFMRALMTGQVLQPATLNTMLTWTSPKESDPEFFPIQYGLGMFKMETPQGEVYFHSGDAIGYYANVLYFPENNTTVCYAANGNYGKIDQYISYKNAIEKVLEAVK